jgi:predicted MFS family arabinose efflux permease
VIARIVRVYRDAFAGLPRAAWIIALAGFINRSGTMVLPFLAIYLTARRGFSPAGAGALLSLFGVGSSVGSLLGGWLCDRLDANLVQFVSLLGGGIGLVALGQVASPWAIGVTLFLVALVGEAYRPASSTALARACRPADRPRIFALRRLALNLGMTFGPAIGGLLAVHDYAWLFILDGATCMLAAIPVWTLVAPRRPRSAPSGPATAAADPGVSPWRDGPFLALVGLVSLLAVVFFQLWGTYPLTMRHAYHLPEDRIGLLFAVNTLLIVGFEMVLIHLLRALSPLRVAAAGALLLAGGLGLVPLGSTFAFAAACAVVWTIGEMLSLPLLEAVVANRAGSGRSGRYMGLYMSSFSVAFILAPLVGTTLYERFGSDVLWAACGLAGLPLGAGFLALERRIGRGIPPATAAPV